MAAAKDKRDVIFDLCESDFAAVLRSSAFVDKTLIIKDIFDESHPFLLITAPPRSGKSTIMDMVRRFLEIEVDDHGKRQPLTLKNNYTLFTQNDLQIHKLSQFFAMHFGNHPVLYMDWKPLDGVSDFRSMVDTFKTIMTETFRPHRYFLKVQNVWTDDLKLEDFKNYCFPTGNSSCTENEIIHSFKYLSELLFRYFKKKIFVLIDNCDAFVNKTLFLHNKQEDRDRMFSFVKETVSNLLKNNVCVGRALLTGVLPLIDDGFLLKSIQVHDPSISLSDFGKYYGLTPNDLDKILKKLVIDNNEIERTKKSIKNFLNLYNTDEFTNRIYNTASVLQYVYIKKLFFLFHIDTKFIITKTVFKHYQIRKKIIQLLRGEELQVDIDLPLSTTAIVELNNLTVNGPVKEISSFTVNTFLILLHHFGYLSINRILFGRIGSFIIPNKESTYDLANSVLETCQELYCSKWDHAENVCSAINLIKSDSFDLGSFNKILAEWYQNLTSSSQELENTILTRLLVILFTSRLYIGPTAARKLSSGDVVILLQNTHYVQVCITEQLDTSDAPTDETLNSAAENACNQVKDSGCREQVFDDVTPDKKITVGIGYSLKTRECRVMITNY